MASFLQNLLGGKPAAQTPLAQADSDFADFAGIPNPSPVPHAAESISSAASAVSSAAAPTGLSFFGNQANAFAGRPYTKWYRVWERTTFRDFQAELFIIPFIILVVAIHLWGSGKNKRKVRNWASTHVPVLEQEFPLVGVEKKRDVAAGPMGALRMKSACEYISYASGRQNIAFVDIKITLHKRYNPMARFGEEALAFFFESQTAPKERMEATIYPFDGKEGEMVPTLVIRQQQAQRAGENYKAEKFGSAYDNFVFAIIHKDNMKQLREERYDLSLTATKDHDKLPDWAAIMSESAEVTSALLTNDLVKAIEQAGPDLFEALIVTDQPIDQPKKLNEAVPNKRISLLFKLPSSDKGETAPLFRYFIRLADQLASNAHFRPEALRRVKATRDEEAKKIKRADEDEKSEERRLKAEKEKKEERDKKLSGMSADDQRKFLERERALDLRRSQKKRTMKA